MTEELGAESVGPDEEPFTEWRGSGPPIIGVGASAGGIDALLEMFPTIPNDSGLAFVVVQHLNPDVESSLAHVLGRVATMPVTVITDEITVEANTIYVIPPNVHLLIEDGRLHSQRPAPIRGRDGVIDEFFISLARDQGENAGCVILSGTGSDGTLGLRAIKENGGLTLAQANATYDGMMRSAVSTGMVDFVLKAEEIGGKLQDYFSFAQAMRRQRRDDGAISEPPEQLAAIIALLRNRTGNDFSGYKNRTIIRRVQRRMHVLQITEIGKFLERLKNDPQEVTLLFQDLLIGVTEFFRDRETFAALRQSVIPELFRGKSADDTIRVWIPGCSTGEEAYSIAMLLREHAATQAMPPRLQIFASDIDERALETARIGRYPASIAKDLRPEYLSRYFVREDGTYRIVAEIREMCLFSIHNLLRDAPFSKQDLISCRNLLIYLNADLQGHIIPLFHYALNLNGYLLLGTSENVTRHPRLFTTVDKTHRIFQRRSNVERRLPEFPLAMPDPGRRSPSVRMAQANGEPSLMNVAERQVLERFAPAFVVINAEGELLQASHRTGKYLELPAGVPDHNLFSMARSGLRVELRALLHRAIASGRTVLQPKVGVGTNGGRQEIDLYVHPLRFGNPTETFYMVVFQDVGAIEHEPAPAFEAERDVPGVSYRQLETELRTTRERLQATSEELESSNEELKSSNEELSSMNEELQSANEELETSKEELQSINEELHTVNAELNMRVDELTRANNDMSNLLDSTQIATIFLDRELLVKGFTPAAKDVFRLVESDTGRSIMHVRPRVHVDHLQDDAERVLRTLSTIERPVNSTESEMRFMMRLLPYRTRDNMISGVVLTFIDITRVAEAEARIERLTSDLRARIQELETLIDLVPIGILIVEGPDPDRILVNQCAVHMMGLPDGHKGLTAAGRRDLQIFDGETELSEADRPIARALRTGEAVPVFEGRLRRVDGNLLDVMVSSTPLFNDNRTVRGAIAALVDISAHKMSEARQRVLLDELQHRVKNTLATVSSLAERMGRRSRSVEEFQDAFRSRLAAMGRTHDLLSSDAWVGTHLRSLLQIMLDSHGNAERSNIVLEGPDVLLTPNTATTLGMVFHELATNAAKYGAWSVEGGVVEVTWMLPKTPDGDRLHIVWVERNGPPVDPSAAEGFGTGFVRRSVAYEMEGTADIRLLPEGLRCDINMALLGNVE